METLIGYNEYLFGCVLKVYNKHFEALPYDEQFQLLPELYKRFTESGYDNPNEGLYECLVHYFKNGNSTI